jgi:phosphoserine aminotransferase
VYVLRNVLAELKAGGGLSAIEKINREKAKLLYDAIEARSDVFAAPVEKGSRSTMNVVFTLSTPELEAEFLAEAKKRGMEGLKGHRSVGGMRASIYNAVSREWVASLADLISSFKK